MLIDSIVCKQPETLDLTGFDIDYISVEWYETSKKVLHKLSKKGTDVGVKLQKDQNLSHGDILWIEGNKVLVIEIPECDCIAIKPKTLMMMGKACYEIGNRHTPLFYQDEELLLPYDEPLFKALKKCELEPYKKSARLISPLGGNEHGHSHTHAHSG